MSDLTTYEADFLAALKVATTDVPVCLNVLLGRRCRAVEGRRCSCATMLHGPFYDHPLMLVRQPRLRVLLLEPYVDPGNFADAFIEFADSMGTLDLHAAIGTPGTGRWARAGEDRTDENLMTVPVAVSPHAWLAVEVAEFDLRPGEAGR